MNDVFQPVYFDSLTITHPQDRALVTQEQHYYPFGMAMSGVAVNTLPQVQNVSKDQFNDGSALQDDLLGAEGGVYSTFYRTYDPATGRFTGVDPLADTYADQSVYQFGNNDPVNFNDPSGALSQAVFSGGRDINPRGMDGQRSWGVSDLELSMSGLDGGGGGPNAQQVQMYKDAISIGLNPHFSANGDIRLSLLIPLDFYTDKGELNSTVWYPWTFQVLGVNNVYNNSYYRTGDSYQPVSGFDIQKAVAVLNHNADAVAAAYRTPYGIHACARYVRYALEAGGIIIKWPWPIPAKDYGSSLIGWGFNVVTSNIKSGDYSAMSGDVAVFQGFGIDHSGSWNGHVEMYNGSQWVSDFKQSQFTPGPGFRNPPAPYIIYRR